MVMNRSADRSMSLTALACVLIVGMLVLPAGFALGPAKALSEPTGPSASVVQEEDGDCEARVQSEPDKGSDPGRIVGVNDVSVFYQDEMDPRIRVDHESSFRVCLEEEGDELVIATACCEGPQVDDAAVRRLVPLMERLPHLRAVEFRDTSITDKGLEPLARLRTVRRLFVRSSAGDKAVPIRLTDAAFERIAKLPNLEVLEISNGTINGEGCRHLRSLSQLRVIDLRRTDVDDTTLEYLEDLPQLREVVLWGTRISDEGLAHLAKLPNLEEVYLMDTDISDKGLDFLAGNKKIRVLDLVRTGVTDGGLVTISQLKSLTELRLGGTKVSDMGLLHLTGLQHLRILGLGNTAVTDTGLILLESLQQLEAVGVGPSSNKGVSEAGCQRLRQALPQCTIE